MPSKTFVMLYKKKLPDHFSCNFGKIKKKENIDLGGTLNLDIQTGSGSDKNTRIRTPVQSEIARLYFKNGRKGNGFSHYLIFVTTKGYFLGTTKNSSCVL